MKKNEQKKTKKTETANNEKIPLHIDFCLEYDTVV